jgi:hypothetical protein
MRLGEGITFMNHALSGGVASSGTAPATIRRARGPDAIADGLLVQLRPLLRAEVLVYTRNILPFITGQD